MEVPYSKSNKYLQLNNKNKKIVAICHEICRELAPLLPTEGVHCVQRPHVIVLQRDGSSHWFLIFSYYIHKITTDLIEITEIGSWPVYN